MFVFPHHSYFGRSKISINVKLQKAAHFDQSHACLPDCSTSERDLNCCLRLRLLFPNVRRPLLVWHVTPSRRQCCAFLVSHCIVCFFSIIFVVRLPNLRVTTLFYTFSCTPLYLVTTLRWQAHCAPLFLSIPICPSAHLRRIIRKHFVPSGHGPIRTVRSIVTVNASVQHLLLSEAPYRRPCSGISLTCSTQHYLVSNQDDHSRQLRYCHAYTRSTRHCQTFHRTRHAITIHCSSLPQPFFTKW